VLCVDVGNSFVKYALASGRRWVSLGKQRTESAAAGRWPAEAKKRKRQLAGVDGVMVSSVVPSVDRALQESIREFTHRRPMFAHPGLVFPFKLAVSRPRVLGIDRACAAAGAVRHGARSVIVVDVGSAITVDLVSRGSYRGGLIIAGPGLALEALSSRTAKLPMLDWRRLERPPDRFDDTKSAMLMGAALGSTGAIREGVRYLDEPLGRPARKIVTGGGAPILLARLPRSWRYDPDLVLRGLYDLWQLNAAPSRRAAL
jgi:type III pantothenate kinase